MNARIIAAALAAAALLAGVAATTATAPEPKTADTAIYDGSPWLKAPVRPPLPR